MSQTEKERSHERIIDSAARIVRERGIEGASVNDVMTDAGMTHGGFYKHFASKEALLIAALDAAFDEIARRLRPDGPASDVAAAAQFQAFYLSDRHLRSPGLGCPIAALSGDVARSTTALKATFGAGVARIAGLIAQRLSGSERARRARAMRHLAMMAGAMLIARASDPETAREVLAACRQTSA